jgi:hypothetical protein
MTRKAVSITERVFDKVDSELPLSDEVTCDIAMYQNAYERAQLSLKYFREFDKISKLQDLALIDTFLIYMWDEKYDLVEDTLDRMPKKIKGYIHPDIIEYLD